jgi:mono/diheme cytochrome c family protein
VSDREVNQIVLISRIVGALLALITVVAVVQVVLAQDSTARGRDVYGRTCAACHGAEGRGEMGPALVPLVHDLEAVRSIVRQGRNMMPPISTNTMSEGDLAQVVAYVKSLGNTASGRSPQAGFNGIQIGPKTLAGVVTSSRGPEAGVWVIAETTETPTRLIKIVVTDDQGRYVLPDLPDVTYRVWVRGYGLVDSPQVRTIPGKLVDLHAVIAPTPQEAAQYYPPNYWLSLIEVPDKSEFPMKVAAVTPGRVQLTDEQAAQGSGMANQQQWIDAMKEGCQLCHQLGNPTTRNLDQQTKFHFSSTAEAWDQRVKSGQQGAMMSAFLDRFGRERAIKMFSEWSNRIAEGEVPQAPPRPQGVERNVVITMWDWGRPQTHVHDDIATDRRKPTINANGLVYGTDYDTDLLLAIDPVRNATYSWPVPTAEPKSMMNTVRSQQMLRPSPYWGNTIVWDGTVGAHNPMMDEEGRVWITATSRAAKDQPEFCKEGSSNPFAKYFPMPQSGKQVEMFDPKTKQFKIIDTCYPTHHLQFGDDKDNTLYFSPAGGPVFGWLNTNQYLKTGNAEKSQGWCPAYLDTNGDGKIDPSLDTRVDVSGYGIIVNPKDNSVWLARPGVPGYLLRFTLGNNPPTTCIAEKYEPPFNNPKMPGVYGYSPRGIDVDRNGVIWTALSGSGQLASFDRRKCAVTKGPSATGQHCPEGWSLYTAPGPKMRGVTEDSSADFEYYNWVDQYNTGGLGDNVPIVNGTDSDSLQAFLPNEKKWVVIRVPYPWGFYSRGLDGRIDDANGGWKGRGLWAPYAQGPLWHMEGGPGTLSKLAHFQFRPNPLGQ